MRAALSLFLSLASTVGLALEPDGSGLIGVERDSDTAGVPCQRLPRTIGVVTPRRADGSFGRSQRLPGDLLAGPLRLRAGRYVALVSRPMRVGPDCNPLAELSLVHLGRDGKVRSSRRLNHPVPMWDAELAVSSGVIAAAWVEEPRWERRRLRVLVAGRVRTLARGPVQHDVALTRLPAGQASRPTVTAEFLLAWAGRRNVHLDQFDRRGRFRPRKVAGRTLASTAVHAGAAQNGRVVVAWAAQDGGEERERPLMVRTTQRGRWGLPFTPARTLGGGGIADDPQASSALAVSPDRSALFVWGDVTRAGTPFYAALAPPRGNLRDPVQLGDGAFGDLSVAFGRGGRAFVTASFEGRTSIYRRGPDTGWAFLLDRELPGGFARLWRQADGSVLATVERGSDVEVLALG